MVDFGTEYKKRVMVKKSNHKAVDNQTIVKKIGFGSARLWDKSLRIILCSV